MTYFRMVSRLRYGMACLRRRLDVYKRQASIGDAAAQRPPEAAFATYVAVQDPPEAAPADVAHAALAASRGATATHDSARYPAQAHVAAAATAQHVACRAVLSFEGGATSSRAFPARTAARPS